MDARTLPAQVRMEKTNGFITLVSDRADAEPSPIDWILDTHTYGMHVGFTTAADGAIEWQGDRITHRRVRFNIGQLPDILHAVVGEARGLLAQLTMVEVDNMQATLPAIAWVIKTYGEKLITRCKISK